MTDERSTCLTRAQAIVDGERDGNHGGVNEQVKHQAMLWSAYLGIEITPWQCAQMMVLHKISRMKCGDKNHPDHLDDQAGWTRVTEKVLT